MAKCSLWTNLALWMVTDFNTRSLKTPWGDVNDDWLETFIKGLFTCFKSHKKHIHYLDRPPENTCPLLLPPFRERMEIIQATIWSILILINPNYFTLLLELFNLIKNINFWSLNEFGSALKVQLRQMMLLYLLAFKHKNLFM